MAGLRHANLGNTALCLIANIQDDGVIFMTNCLKQPQLLVNMLKDHENEGGLTTGQLCMK